jgi:hypothetical protein
MCGAVATGSLATPLWSSAAKHQLSRLADKLGGTDVATSMSAALHTAQSWADRSSRAQGPLSKHCAACKFTSNP